MSVDNGDNDENDSQIMQFVKSAIHKNVNNMRGARRTPFTGGDIPRSFSRRQSAAPTCVIIMSCRAWQHDRPEEDGDDFSRQARTQLRQTSVEIQEENQNILWDTNGPQQSSDHTACIRRLCDTQQILTLDAHGETVTDLVPTDQDYMQNQSNIFWVFPAVTGLSLTSTQYTSSLKALDLLWRGEINRENGHGTYNAEKAWLQFLMGPHDPMKNEVKRALQKVTYPFSRHTHDRTPATEDPGAPRDPNLEASLLSWRVYRPGDLMPVQSYSFWTDYHRGRFFRSGINTLSNILLTNRALNTRSGEGKVNDAFTEPSSLRNFWEIFERKEMKQVGRVNTLPLVPEVTFDEGKVNSINFKLYHLPDQPSPIYLRDIPVSRRVANDIVAPYLKGLVDGDNGFTLNGHTNMDYFTGLCLPSLIDKIPVNFTTGTGGQQLVEIMREVGYNIRIDPGVLDSGNVVRNFRTETGDSWR